MSATVALVSGGKDSIYSIMECIRLGYNVVAVANIMPAGMTIEGESTLTTPDEIDSFMYQTVGHNIISELARSMGLPLYRQATLGCSRNKTLWYNRENTNFLSFSCSSTENSGNISDDEIADMYNLLSKVLEFHPEVKYVASGAIFSTYQRLRVEAVCAKLGLESLAWLWQRSQATLLQDMCASQLHAVMIKCASFGLSKDFLGQDLQSLLSRLLELSESYGLNVCGEGGEYESIVLDSPIFKRSVSVDASELVQIDKYTYYMRILAYSTHEKTESELLGADEGPLAREKEEVYKEAEVLPIFEDWCKEYSRVLNVTSTDISTTSFDHDAVISRPTSCLHTTSPVSPVNEPLDKWLSELLGRVGVDTLFPLPLIDVSSIPTASLTLQNMEMGSTNKYGSVSAQLDAILSYISSFLSSANAAISIQDAVFCRMYLSRMSDFSAANQVFERFFGWAGPCRAAVSLGTNLGQPFVVGGSNTECVHELLVGVELVLLPFSQAYLSCASGDEHAGPPSSSLPSDMHLSARSLLKVESRSRWAPQTIGPYAQGNSTSNSIFGAGQIGLYPPSMQLASGGFIPQFLCALRSLFRVHGALGGMSSRISSLRLYLPKSVWIRALGSPDPRTPEYVCVSRAVGLLRLLISFKKSSTCGNAGKTVGEHPETCSCGSLAPDPCSEEYDVLDAAQMEAVLEQWRDTHISCKKESDLFRQILRTDLFGLPFDDSEELSEPIDVPSGALVAGPPLTIMCVEELPRGALVELEAETLPGAPSRGRVYSECAVDTLTNGGRRLLGHVSRCLAPSSRLVSITSTVLLLDSLGTAPVTVDVREEIWSQALSVLSARLSTAFGDTTTREDGRVLKLEVLASGLPEDIAFFSDAVSRLSLAHMLGHSDASVVSLPLAALPSGLTVSFCAVGAIASSMVADDAVSEPEIVVSKVGLQVKAFSYN